MVWCTPRKLRARGKTWVLPVDAPPLASVRQVLVHGVCDRLRRKLIPPQREKPVALRPMHGRVPRPLPPLWRRPGHAVAQIAPDAG